MATADEHLGYPYRASGEARTRARPETVWRVVSSIGGENRYFTLNALWTVREAMDALIGGEGLVRRRPEGGTLRPGDRIDSWTVLVADAPRRLALLFGMKAPGRGVLEFVIAREGDTTVVSATAYWRPKGLAGVLYWRAMEPAHLFLFRMLTREICRRAERLEAEWAAARVRAAQPASGPGPRLSLAARRLP
ncbi:MAG: DUF2867 domain-containing protein [Elioraea sp.]|nr:DUF2867 domain-containing protein [Elioraea sp.]MDW8443465.1 DUF2867 domain-containing protein [Acetobacteraceae bacterium]